MIEQIGQVLDLVRSVVIDPTSNLTAAVLLMAMLIIVVLILSAVTYLVLVVRTSDPRHAARADAPAESDASEQESDSDEDRDREVPMEHQGTRADRRYLVVGLVVFAIAVAATYVATGTERYCEGACHAGSTAVASGQDDVHATVTCTACHEAGGLSGIPVNVVWRVECVAAEFAGQTVAQRPVRAERCLKCHRAVLDDVIENEERGLRMEHAAPYEAGMSCEDCHAAAGHGTELTAGMNPCLRCHDGESASAECSVCHIGDPTRAAVSERPFPRIRVANRDCGACHDLAPCDACHGTRMPHSETFIAYAHAKEAAFERKESCFICHERSDCGACHASWDLGHGPTPAARRADHLAKMSRSSFSGVAGCTCHNHNPYRNYCAICHEEAGSPF